MSIYHCRRPNGPLRAKVRPPGSKSITNRALVTAALAHGTSVLRGLLLAEDSELMIEALRTLGVEIEVDPSGPDATVAGCAGQLPVSEARIFCGNSGTTIRFMTAVVAAGSGRFELDGVERMRSRPIGALGEALLALGAGVEYGAEPGFPPLVIHGRGLGGGLVGFRNVVSSQLVSGLLLAAPLASQDVFVDVTGAVPSRPYLDMTVSVMDAFGVPVLAQLANGGRGGAKFIVAAPQHYQGVEFTVEPDASNATYFFAAAAVSGGEVTIEGLGAGSVQGDAGFIDVLEAMGCAVARGEGFLTVASPSTGCLRGIDIDLNEMPDTVMTLSVLSLFAEGKTTIRNVQNLRVKETDRLTALAAELTKLGARVTTDESSISIEPPQELLPALIETYDDHRMAMSFALAGLGGADVRILNPECCGKTYPQFFDDFENMLDGGR